MLDGQRTTLPAFTLIVENQAMDEVVRSFVEQRLKPCRHELTLQLFLRSGPFWEP